MNLIYKIALFSALIMVFLILKADSTTDKGQLIQSVSLVELFTSQGCSSCPAADKLLSKTMSESNENGMPIIALSFHVDYWNRLGWKDPFSSEKFTARQQEYAKRFDNSSIYTPQMVVNGTSEFVGSNESDLKNALKKYSKDTPKIQFEDLTMVNENGKYSVSYTIKGDLKESKINIAVVSIMETTYVGRGENQGRTIVNDNLARQFYSRKADITGKILIDDSPLPEKNNMAIIAFVQRESDGKVTGAAMIKVN